MHDRNYSFMEREYVIGQFAKQGWKLFTRFCIDLSDRQVIGLAEALNADLNFQLDVPAGEPIPPKEPLPWMR